MQGLTILINSLSGFWQIVQLTNSVYLMKGILNRLLVCFMLLSGVLRAQDNTGAFTILYTGKSLGALGVKRSQEEQDLLTERLVSSGRKFKLVSHPAWRAPGITVFLPTKDAEGTELASILENRGRAERKVDFPCLTSATNLLLPDPWNSDEDLLGLIWNNPRRFNDYPDLKHKTVTVSRLRTADGERAYIVEEQHAIWPQDLSAWTRGEMNRLDVGTSRLITLPVDLSTLGPRAALIKSLAGAGSEQILKVDLGHEDGDLGVSRMQRARVDYFALAEMGYRFVVPYEFELELGPDSLRKVLGEHPSIHLLASNIDVKDTTLIRPHEVVEMQKFRIGLIGLVNPNLKEKLTRGILSSVTFESPVVAARREVEAFQRMGVSAIVVLSNLDPAENAVLAQEVKGIDAIIADMPARSAPEALAVRVELPDRPFARPGTPGMVARAAAYGMTVGKLDLALKFNAEGSDSYVTAIAHQLFPINDGIIPDVELVNKVRSKLTATKQERGDLIFPAFTDLVARHPELAEYDAVTRLGRVSKPMWESFMARRLRVQGNAEVSVIRRLEEFPSLQGKLREQEIHPWVWIDDAIILLDMPGSDLLALLTSDSRNELATSGINLGKGKILGHNIDENAYYRVATADVLFEGGRSKFFTRARRVRRAFNLDPVTGMLISDEGGSQVGIRDLILSELGRVRKNHKGDAHIDAVAELIKPDPRHVNLFSFYFDRPTIWASLNQVTGNEGFNQVPESRILAKNAFVAGTNGRFAVSRVKQNIATDLGFSFAYAVQKVFENGTSQRVESTDDFKVDLTLRPAPRPSGDLRMQPFLRGLFDSEFTPTVDESSGMINPRQLSLRAVTGMLLFPGPNWKRTDAGLLIENDFGRPNPQLGFQSRSEYERRLSTGHRGAVTYRLRNDFTWFFPAPKDTKANLSLRYQMVHEVLIPLVDELSLSVAADLFFFRGKVKELREPGMSTLLRVGITYDRLWKPRYQPFF